MTEHTTSPGAGSLSNLCHLSEDFAPSSHDTHACYSRRVYPHVRQPGLRRIFSNNCKETWSTTIAIASRQASYLRGSGRRSVDAHSLRSLPAVHLREGRCLHQSELLGCDLQAGEAEERTTER